MFFYGRTISPCEIVNVSPGEGEIPLSCTPERNWEEPAFPKDHKDCRKKPL